MTVVVDKYIQQERLILSVINASNNYTFLHKNNITAIKKTLKDIEPQLLLSLVK